MYVLQNQILGDNLFEIYLKANNRKKKSNEKKACENFVNSPLNHWLLGQRLNPKLQL